MLTCVHPVRLALVCSLLAPFATTASASLVTWYKFDEGTGTTANDSSGNGAHLTANGTVTWNSKASTPFGGSAYFNGGTFRASRYNGASVQPQTIDLLRARTSSKVTITFWANPDVVAQATTAAFGAVQGASTRILQSHLLWSDNNLYWDVGNTSNAYNRVTGSIPPNTRTALLNKWTHWSLQYDAANPLPLKVYRNGSWEYAAATGLNSNINWAGIDSFDIGGAVGMAATWKGAIDDFAIWDEALTQDQIDSIYTKGVGSLVQPVITSFTASPGNLPSAQSTTLSWNVSNASSVSIDQGIGVVAASGTRIVTPSTPTTYTLTAVRGTLTATDTTTVTINQPESDLSMTELMAENSKTLLDEEGNASDWIEIRNPNTFDKSLLGWKLQSGTSVWTFPAVSVPGQAYLVVFASGNNRVLTTAPLHTNFKLSKNGGSVQFLRPDGTVKDTITWPAQKDPYSYGSTVTSSGTTPMITAGQAGVMKYLVPTASTPSNWNTLAFDDSTWNAAADTSIGFDSDLVGATSFVPHFAVNLGTPASGVPHPMWNVNASLYTRYTFNVADKSTLTSLLLKLKYEDGFVAWLNGVEIARGNFAGNPAYNSATGTSRASENLSLVYDSFDVSANGLPALVNGTNVLAIQGMNFATSSSDFLLAPLLEGSGTVVTNTYMTPTPGAANGTGVTGFVADTKFSVPRGIYSTTQTVAITSATADATIRYTTNGTIPTLANGTTYTVPISVSTTTTLRAAAFKTGYVPTDVDTNTYVFPSAVATSLQSSVKITAADIPNILPGLTDLPSISFVLPNSAAFNDDTDIPLSVEWLNPDNTPGFQIDCGTSYFGGTFTTFAKKSFRLNFSSAYGASRLNYPVFTGFERGLKPRESFDSLELRNGSHDMASRGFYMSNTFTDDTLLDMGHVAPHGRYVHLYINGAYWGVYHLRERLNADSLSAYLGGSKKSYEAINGNLNVGGWAEPGLPSDGDGSAWQRAKGLRTSYSGIKPYVDIRNFVDFMTLYMYGNSEHEYRNAGPIIPGSGFKFILNDADGFLNGTTNPWDSNSNNTAISNPVNRAASGDGPGGIFGGLFLAADPDYRTFLADRIHRHYVMPGAP